MGFKMPERTGSTCSDTYEVALLVHHSSHPSGSYTSQVVGHASANFPHQVHRVEQWPTLELGVITAKRQWLDRCGLVAPVTCMSILGTQVGMEERSRSYI